MAANLFAACISTMEGIGGCEVIFDPGGREEATLESDDAPDDPGKEAGRGTESGGLADADSRGLLGNVGAAEAAAAVLGLGKKGTLDGEGAAASSPEGSDMESGGAEGAGGLRCALLTIVVLIWPPTLVICKETQKSGQRKDYTAKKRAEELHLPLVLKATRICLFQKTKLLRKGFRSSHHLLQPGGCCGPKGAASSAR